MILQCYSYRYSTIRMKQNIHTGTTYQTIKCKFDTENQSMLIVSTCNMIQYVKIKLINLIFNPVDPQTSNIFSKNNGVLITPFN